MWLKKTIDNPRITGATNLNNLCTWIDIAYIVHNDMKGQTGGVMFSIMV